MKINILTLLILVFGQGYAQTLDFGINYNVDVKNDISKDVKQVDTNTILASTSYDLGIRLKSNGSFSTSDKEVTTLFDLDQEPIFRYDDDTLYDATPLYSIIDYRIAEYKNRTFLTNMLKAGGVGDAFGDVANLESVFGIEDQENNTRDSIKVTTIKKHKIYLLNENELVKIKYSKTKIPKGYIESFSKYLTYSVKIHPSIKEQIIKSNLVPEYIEYSYTNVGTKTTKIVSLTDAKLVKEEVGNYSKKKMYQRERSQMGGIVDSMMFYTLFNEPVAIDSTQYLDKAIELSNEGKNLSGFLRLLEYLLSTGKQPIEQIRTIASKKETDPMLTTFLYCLGSPRSKEEAQQKVSKLDTLIAMDIPYGYVMNVFAANHIGQIDNYEAKNYFYKALSQNPNISGAWLDLGKIYANRYHYDDAWKCFGIMLNIDENHPMAQEILANKFALKKKYPNYFKSNE